MPYVKQNRRVGLREHLDEEILHLEGCNLDSERVWRTILSYATVESVHRDEVVKELRRRDEDGQEITGDINFCVCRLLVGVTELHVNPSYAKINAITRWFDKALGMIDPRYSSSLRASSAMLDAQSEIYRRYAGPYEDQKCAENGGIMD